MANANSTPARALDRLKVTDYWWGKFYRGTEQDLVNAGILKPEWFPGKPGNPKVCLRVGTIDGKMQVLPFKALATKEQLEKGLIRIYKASKRTFDVRVNLGKEYEERYEERERLKQEVEKQHREKKLALEAAPKSKKEFQDERTRLIRGIMGSILNLFRRSHNGYHYDGNVVEEAVDLINELCSLAETGKIGFDPVRQKYFLDDIEEKAEARHPEFSAFMKATLAIGKAAL